MTDLPQTRPKQQKRKFEPTPEIAHFGLQKIKPNCSWEGLRGTIQLVQSIYSSDMFSWFSHKLTINKAGDELFGNSIFNRIIVISLARNGKIDLA